LKVNNKTTKPKFCILYIVSCNLLTNQATKKRGKDDRSFPPSLAISY
jgi:hypothetical protein